MMSRLFKSIILPVFIFAGVISAFGEAIDELPVKVVSGREYYYYEVKPKETFYSLCKRFSISIDQLLDYNPSQKDGLKAYATLYFPVDVFGKKQPTHQDFQTQDDSYVSHNEPSGQISENPITVSPNSESGNTSTETLPSQQESASEHPRVFISDDTEEDSVTTISDQDISPLSVTIMLPLETSANSPSQLAHLYTEFYRGFLLGVEKYSHSGMPININVIDTSISDDEFDKLLDSEMVASTDLFIGPESESRLMKLAEKANETDAYIINAFVINDELYQSNKSVVQTNIPRNEMYEGAIGKFLSLYPKATPVFIARVDCEADKLAFTDLMKEKLDAADRNYKEIVYNGVLTLEDLSPLLLDGDYIFVPIAASRAEFGKYISGIRDFKNAVAVGGGSATLFGYPEWTTFRGDQLDHLKEMNATIYSRFVNPDNFNVTNLRSDYKKWYGEDWMDVEPNQAILGYDIARYALERLRQSDGDFMPSALRPYSGLQSSIYLSNVYEGAGYVNGAMYVMSFKMLGSPEIEVISVPINLRLAQ